MRYNLVQFALGAALALCLAGPALGAVPATTETPILVAADAASAPASAAALRAAAMRNGTPSVPAKLYAPGSQLRSWPMRVFVTRDLPMEPPPVLTLSFGHAVLDAKQNSCADIPASQVARHQLWTGGAGVDKADSQHVGTFLVFDLSSSNCTFPFWKPMTRALPMVTWAESSKVCEECKIMGTEYINLGNPATALGLAAIIVAFIAGLILFVAERGRQGRVIELLFSSDGHLSLAMCQMALWTLAVGFMVLFELLIKLDAADIPTSLIVLMGLSVATTGASYRLNTRDDTPSGPGVQPVGQDGVQAQPQVPAPVAQAGNPAPRLSPRQRDWSVSDLVSIPSPDGTTTTLALSRAQMLFWTLIVVAMFIAKSVMSQSLWDIPWALVALLGVSQVGYLGGKLAK